jgi:signal transduction histidine kinase
METGETVATGNAVADPSIGQAQSVVLLDLRTIVCIPLRSPRADEVEGAPPRSVGAIYVDNQETSAPFSGDSLKTVEALARHAALAIENALLFEREQKRIEELRTAQTQLLQSEKLATIGQMAAGIAHELNTPLTYIMGNLELLQNQPASAGQKEMLSSIAVGAERITSLAQRLLAFSRPAQEEPVEIAVNDVVERSLELCHYQILKGGVQLRKELSASLPRVRGVSNQLETALINLVVNAVHAMEGGGTLQVATASRDGHVEIAVADTGQGIPVEIQPTIFEPFFTTKPEGKGTGLGLSTVLMIVERHKGRIEFTSAGETTFRATKLFHLLRGAPRPLDAPLRASPSSRRLPRSDLPAAGVVGWPGFGLATSWGAAQRAARGVEWDSRGGCWHAACLDTGGGKPVPGQWDVVVGRVAWRSRSSPLSPGLAPV